MILIASTFLGMSDFEFLLFQILHHRSIQTHTVPPRLFPRYSAAASAPIVGAIIGIITPWHGSSVSVRSDCPACMMEWVIVSTMVSGHLEVGDGGEEGIEEAGLV